MTPFLSIIIPVYKVEPYLGKCLDSIVGCNGLEGGNKYNIEVIVVDDGSPDKSGEIADGYSEKYPYFRVIHKQNAGVAAARNTGIMAASGEWLYFMDSDDWLADGALGLIQRQTLENPDADILLMDAYKDTPVHEEVWEHFKAPAVFDNADDIGALWRGMLYFPLCDGSVNTPLAAPWDKVYNRKFVSENKLTFRENLKVLDDMVFNMEAFGRAAKVVYSKDRIYHYRYVEASITNSYRPDRVARDMEVFSFIEGYMDAKNADELFRQAYYCRVIKSFSICCRLSFFNHENGKAFHDKLAYVRKVMGSSPYREAFRNVRMKNAEWRLKVVIVIGRLKSGFGLWLLHVAQNGLR